MWISFHLWYPTLVWLLSKCSLWDWKTASGSLNMIDSLAKFDGGKDVFRPQVFNSLWQMETFKWYFIKPNVLYVAYRENWKYKTLGEFALCEWASKGQLTSFLASARRRVIVRVRLPLPTRPGRGAGKGTPDQLAELGSPVWKSGQLMPVNQIKGHKYREEGDETYMYFWLNVNVWVAVGTHIWPAVTKEFYISTTFPLSDIKWFDGLSNRIKIRLQSSFDPFGTNYILQLIK